jgi:hypothetical protein
MSGSFSARLSRYYVLLDELRALRLRHASDDEDIDAQEKIEVLVDSMSEPERAEARRYTWRAWPERFAAQLREGTYPAPSHHSFVEGDQVPPRQPGRRVA